MNPPNVSARSIAFPVAFETSWMALPASTRDFGSSVISSPPPARQIPRRRYRQGESRGPSSRDARRTSSGQPDARRPLPLAGCGRGPGDVPEGVSSCRFVKKYPERKRDRILSDDEYRRLATALGTPSAGSFALAVAIAATRLLMLAECGNGEVLSLRREEVALERSELRLCDAKTEAKAVHRRDEQPVRETHRFGLCLGGGGQDVRTGRRCAGGIVTRLPCPHSCTSPSCTGTAFARGAPSELVRAGPSRPGEHDRTPRAIAAPERTHRLCRPARKCEDYESGWFAIHAGPNWPTDGSSA